MLSSAELFKSPEARIDEGGIGGTVILHTRRPLEMEANSGYVNLEGTSSDTSHDVDPQVAALYSWHSKDERFGVLVGVTQQKRTSRTMETSTEDYQWYGNNTTARDANGNLLADGDNVTVIKDLKVKGSSSMLKIGTKVKGIRLVEGDHNIDCKIDGFGPMKLKSEFVKKN